MANGSVAVVLLNRGGGTATVSTTAAALGLGAASSYSVRDLWAHTHRHVDRHDQRLGARARRGDVRGHRRWHAAAQRGLGPARHGSGRCLDVTGATQTNGAAADRSGTATARRTSRGPRPAARNCGSTAQSAWTSTTRGTANGTAVIIWDCNGQTNQQWRFNADGTVTAVGAGRCLDLVGNGTANGTRTQIWDCNGAASQRWSRT